MLQPAWLYLYKAEFWKENNFEYPVGKLHEDFALTSLIMLKAKKVASTNVYGYYYYQSNSSITRGNDQQKIMKRALDMLYHLMFIFKIIFFSNCLKFLAFIFFNIFRFLISFI